jgi:hypothetical protein
VKRFLLSCTVLLAVACSTDDRFRADHKGPGSEAGKTADVDAAPPKGVCELSDCPRPEVGLACCTPLAQCGTDPSGLGLTCVPNAGGAASELVCNLSDCAEPTVGIACCTPFAQCGFDPFSSGLWCFANPADVNVDGMDAAVCNLDECPAADGGPAACCLPNGECGVDSWGIGVCFAPPPEPIDASFTLPDAAMPDYDSVKPDHPSIDPSCGGYIAPTGPVWGCCTTFGVCGTFLQGTCQLPVGTVISGTPLEDDAGEPIFPYCTPPAAP